MLLSRASILFIILSAFLFLAGCRRAEEPKAPTPCPAVEGSYFGSDQSGISKADAVRLSWRLPLDYVNDNHRIEKTAGGETSRLELDTAAMREAANPAA